jgi:GTPase
MSAAGEHRAGFVVLGGRSNVGKSTLLNRIVGQKVAIVTPRPQTTRRRILGIRTDPDAQILLIDTPGIHNARSALNQKMVQTARRALSDGEVVVAVIDAGDRLDPADRAILAEVRTLKHPAVVAINKIDLIERPRLLPLADECRREFPEAEIVPVSALTGENVDELLKTIKQMLPPSPPLMPGEEFTDQTERMLAEEIVREQIFLKMREEVPFSTAVRVEAFAEDAERGGLRRIAALIVVERDSHKGMLIGAGGRTLKDIGTRARIELERMLGARVFLELHVKVERGWTRDARKVAELGG